MVPDPRSVKDAYAARTGFISQPLEGISRNILYAALTFLSKHKDTIVRNFSRRTHEITGRKNTMMFYDVTSLYFETPLSDEEKQLFNHDAKLKSEAFKLITDYCNEYNCMFTLLKISEVISCCFISLPIYIQTHGIQTQTKRHTYEH